MKNAQCAMCNLNRNGMEAIHNEAKVFLESNLHFHAP